MKFKTYLFDFDGTLVDSMPAYVGLMLRILDENNIKYENDIIKIITPLGYIGTAKYYRENLGVSVPEDELIALMNSYAYNEYAHNIPAKDSVIEVLKRLKAEGADLNVLTASPHTVLDVCLKRLGIYDLFTNVWSCDDFGTTKADVGIYKTVADRLGKPIDEILFLDDNYNADKTAHLAGMAVCGVYDSSSEEYTQEIKSVSDYYITNFRELFEI